MELLYGCSLAIFYLQLHYGLWNAFFQLMRTLMTLKAKAFVLRCFIMDESNQVIIFRKIMRF